MPLRTNRGKAAAVRSFWTWPLRSGRHLIGTIVVVAVAVTGLVYVADAIRGPQPQPTSTAAFSSYTNQQMPPSLTSTTSTSSPASTTTPTSTPSTSSTPTLVPAINPADLAITAAENFMKRWVRPAAGTTTDVWSRGIAPYVMPESLVELKNINPDNVPATALTGQAKVTDSSSSTIGIDVPTDAGVIHVIVVNLPDGRWLVRKWLPVA